MSNRFLSSLPQAELAELEPHFEDVGLNAGDVLHSFGGPVDYIYFPKSGLVSLVIVMQSGQTASTSIVGRNGMVCSGGLLDASEAIDQATVEIPGPAARIRTSHVVAAYRESEPLRARINRYHAVVLAEAQQSVACNALHNLEERLSRWLLEAHDRTGLQELPLTQEFLSSMLGVQRTSVTLVQHKLAAAGLTSTHRGMIVIENIEGLRECSCECYALLRARAERILPGWATA